MGLTYVDKILYDAQGYTGNTYYCRFVRKRDGQIWDGVAGALATNPTWADAAVTVSETGTTGQYSIVIPEDLPAAVYDVVVYLQVGGTPQNTDGITLQYDTKVGSIFRF